MSRVAGVILAAGGSSRLGQPKQLLPLGGRPVIAHTVAAARQSSLDPIVLVVGAYAAEILDAVDTSDVIVVHNPDFAQGQSTSLKAGTRALPEDVGAAVFLLGDQPLVEPRVIAALLAARRASRAQIVQPLYHEGPGNPVLIGRELFDELAAVTGDTGARPLLRLHQERIARVPVDAQRPLDIDTRDDYERVRQTFEAER